MNQKQIGIILIIVGILMTLFVYTAREREDNNIKLIMQNSANNSCFLEDGTCLHKQNTHAFLLGGVLSISLILFGIYLSFVDKTQKVLAEHQVKVSSALKEAKKDDKFNAFLSGFNEDSQKVLKAIKEQDGIKQSTLRFRTGISKSSLSLVLKELENKKIISRKKSGKTNEVYLRGF